MRNTNPRPRKYATDDDRRAAAAARQAAYRERYAVLTTRVRPELAETLERISSETLVPVAELIHQMIQFALTNRNWYMDASFVKKVTTQSNDDRRRGTKYRKDSTLRNEDDEA